MIKAVFFDIDGTLVSFRNHKLAESTHRALIGLKDKGIKIFIATGRAEMLIDNIETELFDGIVSVNGQMARSGGEIIYKKAFEQDDVRRGIDYIMKTGVSCLFEGVNFMVLNKMNDRFREADGILNIPVSDTGDISGIAREEIIQMIFFGNEQQEREILQLMPSCESTRWSPIFVDIISRGGGKHVGMQKILDHHGIMREESMAFGDGGNDISMLRHAGIGVAMGNASDVVKAAADYVTASVDQDGITAALRHYRIL